MVFTILEVMNFDYRFHYYGPFYTMLREISIETMRNNTRARKFLIFIYVMEV
jgi:hypothetical protein